MAWLEVAPSGQDQIVFRFGRRKFKKSLRTGNERDAEAACLRVEENIRLVERGRMTIPPDASVATFLLSDGKVEAPIRFERAESLGQLISRYLDAMSAGIIEDNSLKTIEIHTRHLQRLIGKSLSLTQLKSQVLQQYIRDRSKEGLTSYFKFYSHERPHQSLADRMLWEVHNSR